METRRVQFFKEKGEGKSFEKRNWYLSDTVLIKVNENMYVKQESFEVE